MVLLGSEGQYQLYYQTPFFSLAHRHTVHVQVLYPGWDELKCESTVFGEPYAIHCGISKMLMYSVEDLVMVLRRTSCIEQQTVEEWVSFTSRNLSMVDVWQSVS